MPRAMQPGPCTVIAPHFDDAILSCGQMLAAAAPPKTVLTVCGGRPASYATVTDWDARCGFAAGDDVIAARRDEEQAALDIVGASGHWLDFPDAQYGAPPSASELARSLALVLDQGQTTIFVPVGLFHGDHRLTSDAAMIVAAAQPERTWVLYEDVLYRTKAGLTEARIAELRAAGYGIEPVVIAGDPTLDTKRRAVARYASQLRGLASTGWPMEDVLAPERYWRFRAR